MTEIYMKKNNIEVSLPEFRYEFSRLSFEVKNNIREFLHEIWQKLPCQSRNRVVVEITPMGIEIIMRYEKKDFDEIFEKGEIAKLNDIIVEN